MIDSHLEIAADFACGCGEGPLWNPDRKLLYWIDVDEGSMFSYDPAKKSADEVYNGTVIGGTTLHEDGRILLFMDKGAIKLWSPSHTETIVEEIEREKETRFNDVIADPEGRVFCGTMPDSSGSGRLYRLDPDGSLHVILEKAGQPNGMAFSPDLKYLYVTDTQARTITRFHYGREDGSLTQPHVLIRVPDGEGSPDGLTVDDEGCLWSARWDGACVVRYDAAGEEMSRLLMPVQNVTSITFVDSHAYVTTAGGKDRPEGEKAGALFRVDARVKGRPEFRSRGHVKR